MRIELTTSSLPRKCSTTELQRHYPVGSYQFAVTDQTTARRKLPVVEPRAGDEASRPSPGPPTSLEGCKCENFQPILFAVLSGRRGSNSPPIAWKAIALPNELLPHLSACHLLEANHFILKIFLTKLPTFANSYGGQSVFANATAD